MGMWIGRNRKARVTYGFDEIALVPGEVTINPNEVDTSFEIPRPGGREPLKLKIPIIASAMDGVTNVRFCIEMAKLGGLGVVNLEGVQTRYDDPEDVLAQIAKADKNTVTELIQKLYLPPIKEELIAKRVQELRKGGGIVAVSSIPQKAERFAAIAQEAGADLFVVQSTVSTVRHISSEYKSLDLAGFTKASKIPIIIGNAVTYSVVLELMENGVSGVLIGVGPGAACTSRGVLGLGVPQVTATVDCAAARDAYFKKTGKLRPDHHRRRHVQGRRRLQGAGLRLGCRHGRLRLRPRRGSARRRQSLGHGHAAREPAARHPRPRRRHRLAQADPLRPGHGRRRLAESRRRDRDLHGQRRRLDDQGIPGNRDHHRPLDQDRRQALPDRRISLRGTRVHVGVTGSLKQILFGPATVDDGSQNLVGVIATCMGNVGASTIKEFQETEIIIAPSIKTEGKLFQTVQGVGMGTR